jgi:hypothetical protein
VTPASRREGGADRWSALQDRYRAAAAAERELRSRLQARYGCAAYAPRAARVKLKVAERRERRAHDACFAWLSRFSTRDWNCGVPFAWVCSELTFADAITSGPLSVEPPLAYGTTRRRQEQALAVRQETA